jgi:uncharacterized protein
MTMSDWDGTKRQEQYSPKSWLDPRVDVGQSQIHGQGSFGRALIKAGEVVIIWGGKLFSLEEVEAGNVKPHTVAAISERLVLAAPANSADNPDQYLNHSCDPNLWMEDEITLAARRDILPGEELTADYAFWEWDEDFIACWNCNCRSRLCRGIITGKDWRLPELQQRYRGHFSPFLDERIARVG